MTPNFALGLTEDGITLWHRDASGWLRVGAVATDSPTLDSEMRALAEAAERLAPEKIITKIVVPEDQVLYCDLDPGSGTTAQQDQRLRAQLAGRTPYPVEELEFDWLEDGGNARLAVVARETILEAEEFARGYGFNPVCAVAAPSKARYPLEPIFCTTRTARELFEDPSVCVKSRDLVREIGVVAEKTLSDTEAPETKTAEDLNGENTLPAENATASTETDPKSGPEPAPSETAPETEPKAASPKPAAAKQKKARTDASESAAQLRKNALLARLTAARGKSALPSLTQVTEGQVQTDQPAAPASPPTGAEADKTPATFRSRRAQPEQAEPTPALADAKSDRARTNPLKALLAKVRGTSARPATNLYKNAKALSEKTLPRSTEQTVKDQTVKDAERDLPKADGASTPPAHAKKPSSAPAHSPAPAHSSADAAPRKDPLTRLREHGTRDADRSEAERLTIFGARNQDDFFGAGRNRALLVLGGVAMLLVAVGIWAAYFFATQPAPEQIAAESIPSEETVAAAPEPAGLEQTETSSDAIEAALGIEDAAQQPPLAASDAEPALAEPAEQPSTDAPTTTALDADAGRLAALRSVALIPPVEAVPLPSVPQAPAAFGADPLPPTRSELAALAETPEPVDPAADQDIAAEPSDLPEGEAALEIAVTQGAPAAVPPQRPDGLVSEAELIALQAAAAAAEPEQPEPLPEAVAPEAEPLDLDPFDESALAIEVISGTPAATPPQRPEALAPEPVQLPAQTLEEDSLPDAASEPPSLESTDEEEQASLTTPPPGGLALSALRPATRPAALAEAAAQAAEADDQAFADASDLAVPASLRPGTRPSQFAAVVQRTLSAAQRSQTPAAAAAPEPVQTARAAVTSAAPAIPTSASVAREATQARAINLRQINLIGVMGTSSNRRALVRLSNGRVVTVRVGESLDGGQVTAIGDSELRYTRRGRDVVLRLAS